MNRCIHDEIHVCRLSNEVNRSEYDKLKLLVDRGVVVVYEDVWTNMKMVTVFMLVMNIYGEGQRQLPLQPT